MLEVGIRLSIYEIVAPRSASRMREVYLAAVTRLDRNKEERSKDLNLRSER